jgi:hypothetical protein
VPSGGNSTALGDPFKPKFDCLAAVMRWIMINHLLFAGVGWTDLALTLNRIAVGAFFMLSGYHKLFNEPGALQYEYNVGDDHKTVDIYERYADSKAGLFYLGQTFPNFSKEFFALAKPTRFVIYGTPTDGFKKAVADFHPEYMTPLDGFTK